MKELVYLKNDEAVCSSLDVAEKFEKRHGDVIRAIENLIKNDSTQNCVECFKESMYEDITGKQNKMYVMNRNGFSFLVMGFTGKRAFEWKWQYIKAFNTMENFIREKATQAWIETRKQGKLTRQAETAVIKQLVAYAKEQGSEHSEMLYVTYSKLANKMTGIQSREFATVAQLNQLTFTENIILNQIRVGMEKGLHYKQIYQDCKRQIQLFKDIAYLDVHYKGGKIKC